MTIEINQPTPEIFSSTGRLGVSRRPFERLYVNGTHFSDNSEELEQNYTRLVNIGQRHVNRIGRVMFRGLVSRDVMQHISNIPNLQEDVEVAMPVHEFTGDPSWFVYLARNRQDRQRIIPEEVMMSETNQQAEIARSPRERVIDISNNGYGFTNQIADSQVDHVFHMWGETFGWSREEVIAMRNRLRTNAQLPPEKRNVWFSAITDRNGNIVSAAMAEQLSIPGSSRELSLVESTEWRTDSSHSGRGLMTANLAMLNAQVLHDFSSRGETPLIYAECNFQSRSDRSGHGAGFVIPARTESGLPAPQILVQNVDVHDGQRIPEGKLRDFTFMYLPVSAIQTLYSSESVRQMLMALPGR